MTYNCYALDGAGDIDIPIMMGDSSTDWAVTATVAAYGTESEITDDVCILCKNADMSDYKEWARWTIEFKDHPCSSVLTDQTTSHVTNLNSDFSGTSWTLIYPVSDSSTWVSYDNFF